MQPVTFQGEQAAAAAVERVFIDHVKAGIPNNGSPKEVQLWFQNDYSIPNPENPAFSIPDETKYFTYSFQRNTLRFTSSHSKVWSYGCNIITNRNI